MLRITFILALILSTGLYTQAQELTRILFIFDASNSMNGKWEGSTKIVLAREILGEAIDELQGTPNLEIALRVYGHQSPVTPTFQDCDDTKLEVPFGPDNYTRIKNFVNRVEPKGTTPIARSLEAAAEDFPDANARNVIILITDGLEACDQFPCEVARKLKEKEINVTPFVVGLGIDLKYLNEFDCIGRFYEASTAESFRKVMKSVISDALLNTTAQINLNDLSGKPTETNTTVFLYKAGTSELKYTFMHTMNFKGVPDTIVVIDPAMQYDMVVNTLPKVMVKDLKLYKGQHNILPANCPQGMLKVRIQGPSKKYDVKIRVTQKGKSETLNVQELNDIQRYIVGEYDVEILTLPRIYYNSVKIDQSQHTYLDIDGSGQVDFISHKGIVGQIFLIEEGKKDQWVCDLPDNSLKSRYFLQPGKYKVVYRIKEAVSTDYTTVKPFTVKPGAQLTVNL
ncbi:MAG: VWA domain-containing protein [Crocinitomicaceae bacterium]|nr:VWA domain-containing protein [Crocinitomicaceae bacterium]